MQCVGSHMRNNFFCSDTDWTDIRATVKKSWGIQRGKQNPYIEEKQTTQWPTEKVQKDKQRSIHHTHKTKDRVTRTPLKSGEKPRWSGRV